jgi:hypothetical protein
MPVVKGTWTDMGDELIHNRGGDSRIMVKRGPRGNYTCILIQPIFLNFLLVYEPSNF